MRKKRLIAIILLLTLSKGVFACTCGWGEYFYPISKLEENAIEPQQYYQKNYGIKNLNNLKGIKLKPKIKDSLGFMEITLPIPENLKNYTYHFILESRISLEPHINKGFINNSIFKRAIFKPNSEIIEISTRMKSKGNEWFLYLIAINSSGKIVAIASHTGKDTCGKDIYVKSLERAKELDKVRESGCFQFKKI